MLWYAIKPMLRGGMRANCAYHRKMSKYNTKHKKKNMLVFTEIPLRRKINHIWRFKKKVFLGLLCTKISPSSPPMLDSASNRINILFIQMKTTNKLQHTSS